MNIRASVCVCHYGSHIAKLKNVNMTLIDFDVCYRMMSLRKLYSVTLTYFLNVTSFNIAETVKASAKCMERSL